ncbi:MAG TPA: hypothetical protein VF377_08905 [Acidimicrobiia bacterium]
MSVEIVEGEDFSQLDGSTLRAKLEEALAENRSLKKELATSRAKEILGSNGFSLVKPEDLAGVKLEEMEAKAKELQEQRLAERRAIVEDLLKAKGFEGDELKAEVEAWLSGGSGSREEPKDGGTEDGSWSTGLTGGQFVRDTDKKLPPMDDPMANFTSHFSKK